MMKVIMIVVLCDCVIDVMAMVMDIVIGLKL